MKGWLIALLVILAVPFVLCPASCALFYFVGNRVEPSPRTAVTRPAAPAVTSRADVLPGVTPADVYLNLTNKGFDKSGPDRNGDYTITSDTPGSRLEVTLATTTGTDLTFVRGAATVKREAARDEAEQFIGFIASTPIEGVNAAEARAWVESEIDGEGQSSRKFGRAIYELSEAPAAIILIIRPAS